MAVCIIGELMKLWPQQILCGFADRGMKALNDFPLEAMILFMHDTHVRATLKQFAKRLGDCQNELSGNLMFGKKQCRKDNYLSTQLFLEYFRVSIL